MVDPRRKLDEKYERDRTGRVPSMETYTERVLENQPLGPPVEHEIIVMRLKKSSLVLYSWAGAFALLLALIAVLQSGD